ncbi:heterokaryon incompatibility protein-domain-containing protein [Xylogone sp. PMI_703]|nr:heterokaryon incompatibility protein-domain-containing protein [Xylogone sp. PMI_703]
MPAACKLTRRVDQQPPKYAILSHTWGEGEVSYQDMRAGAHQARGKSGFSKIEHCCAQAHQDEFKWVWIDTCCIDKSSSSELSEAINSMYRWYEKSHVCYAYLVDVPPLSPELDEDKFRSSRWFTRGWTLQELIAPQHSELGTKASLRFIITEITDISQSVLLNMDYLSDHSVGERMSWAASRSTTRVEDKAYSLLSIFDVNMLLIYGEGPKAFIRLQEEILRRSEDYSLLLWHSPYAT